MKRELKIIMTYNMDDGEAEVPTLSQKTSIYLDGKQVGLIQDIKVQATVEEILPKVDITFPNLFDSNIASHYANQGPDNLVNMLKTTISDLKDLPNVNVVLKDLK